ncbi:acyl-CoA dehydrogenase family protein [Ruegeria profundi]|uniref:Acyl-CoA dehydrogenase n=1 Tax=Ruegeria profundi TaxID=1685378 RepID=A0A0X3TZZ6_9RHOB|nr:acyl-CoA dehydrogenase family protein [Ruegeria profundi]KUJ81297.1 hypothetical protein AVO44_05435 [Ruegeria profundi]
MNFERSEDHAMLADMFGRFLQETSTPERRNDTAWTAPFFDQTAWSEMVKLGILGAFVSEDLGGLGGSAEDVSVVFEEIGRALSTDPYLGTLMGLRLLAESGETDLVKQIMAGARRPAFAVFEPEISQDLSLIGTVADEDGKLTGRKSSVYGAPGADLLLIAARNDQGLGLYLIEDVTSVQVLAAPMQDGGGIADLLLEGTQARPLKAASEERIEDVLDLGRIALCAEAVGAMDALVSMTTDYLKQRKQFGRNIASFQALQHRIVDMTMWVEQARSITIRAVASYGTGDQRRHTSMAKNLIGRAAELCAEEAIQLHGGIGMTWEYPGAHYAKRLIMLDHQLGGRHDHAMRLIAMKKENAA